MHLVMVHNNFEYVNNIYHIYPFNSTHYLFVFVTVFQKKSEDEKTPISSPFQPIRQLDSEERWIERNAVVTKPDHASNLACARSILNEMTSTLQVYDKENDW